MFLDLYRPDLVQIYAHLVVPYERHHYQHQFFEPYQIGQVGRLDVEAAGLHGFEAHLYLPPLLIIALGFLRPVEGHDDQKIVLLQPAPRKVAQLAVYRDDFVIVPVPADLQAVEQVEVLDRPVP